MATFRIIPCLDIDQGRVVKGTRFKNIRDAGDPIEAVQVYSEQGADELVFLDITASHEKRAIVLDLVKKVSDVLFIPFCVGGGIRTIEDIHEILHEGADKVAINTAGFQNPHVFTEAAEKFGSQCIVCAIDTRFNGEYYEVYLHGGRTPTRINAVTWAKEVENRGSGEILLTSMDRDGTKTGFDIELLEQVVSSVSIPVIASGGVGKISHFLDAYKTGATAALAASIFHYKELSVVEVKEYLKKNDVEVRI